MCNRLCHFTILKLFFIIDTSVQLADICSCNETSGKCTLNVTLEFGHVMIPEESTGLAGPLHMLGFNAPGPGDRPGEPGTLKPSM